MGNLSLPFFLFIYLFLIYIPVYCNIVQLVELDVTKFMNIVAFPPEDDYVVLFYANWNIASNQFQSTYLNVAQTIAFKYSDDDENRKIIFAKFSCGKYPQICSKYQLNNIPAILFFTDVILDKYSEYDIPHSTRFPGNLNLYEQVQDFVEIWISISSKLRFINKIYANLLENWNESSKKLNDILNK